MDVVRRCKRQGQCSIRRMGVVGQDKDEARHARHSLRINAFRRACALCTCRARRNTCISKGKARHVGWCRFAHNAPKHLYEKALESCAAWEVGDDTTQ